MNPYAITAKDKLRQSWEKQKSNIDLSLFIPLHIGLGLQSSHYASPTKFRKESMEDRGDPGDSKRETKAEISEPIKSVQASSGSLESQEAAVALREFLASEARCLLLLGDSGVGKSLLGHWLTQIMWENQKSQTMSHVAYIPIYIPLAAQSCIRRKSPGNFLTEFLTNLDLNPIQLDALKTKQPLLLFLDGYDEMPSHARGINLYRAAELSQWKVKVIFTCRTDAVRSDQLETVFAPYENKTHSLQPQGLVKRYLLRLNDQQITDYIEGFLQKQSTKNTHHKKTSQGLKQEKESMLATLKKIPGLFEIVRTPFALAMVVEVLPELLKKHQEAKNSIEQLYLTRLDIYRAFTQHHFLLQKQKLLNIGQIKDTWEIEKDFERFSQRLAIEMWRANLITVEYNPKSLNSTASTSEKDPWASFFAEKGYFENDKNKPLALVRSGCHLLYSGNHRAFWHKSLLEYFASQRIFHSSEVKASMVIGQELNVQLLNDEPTIIQFAAEEVQRSASFEKMLRDILEESKREPKVAIAAANAITILVAAGVSFSGENLQSIRIRGADLSYGLFDSANMQRADLRDVKVTNTWLRKANLTGTCLEGIKLGELPYIKDKTGVKVCSYSPDGRWFAVASGNDISIYETKTQQLNKRLVGHKNIVTSITWCPEGEWLASGSRDCTVRLWNREDPTKKAILQKWCDEKSEIYSVAWHPRKMRLAVGGDDKTVWVLNLNLEELSKVMVRNKLQGQDGAVSCVAWHPQKKNCLASGSLDGSVRIWNTSRKVASLPFSELRGHGGIVTSVAWHPSGKWLAVGGNGKSVRLWDTHDLDQLKVAYILRGHENIINSIAWHPTGEWLASGGNDKTTQVWNTRDLTQEPVFEVSWSHEGEVNSVAWQPGGEWLASGNSDAITRIRNIGEQTKVMTSQVSQNHTHQVSSVAWHPKGGWLASGSRDNTVLVWNMLYPVRIPVAQILRGHTNGVKQVVWHPEKALLASGGWDKTVRIWDMKQTPPIQQVSLDHKNDITSLAWCPENGWLTSGSIDGKVIMWDTNSMQPHEFMAHERGVRCLAWHPEGNWLATGSWDNTLAMWNMQAFPNAPEQVVKEDHKSDVTTLAWHPKGERVAAGTKEGAVFLWDTSILFINKMTLLRKFEYHKSGITSLVWHPHEAWLASGSGDCTVQIWNVDKKECLLTLSEHQTPVTSISWWQRGETSVLAVGSKDHSVRCWELKQSNNSLQAKLTWSSHRPRLSLKECKIAQATGVCDNLYTLFNQYGAIGKRRESKEGEQCPSDKILALRNNVREVDIKQGIKSVFGPTHLLHAASQWTVALARKCDEKKDSSLERGVVRGIAEWMGVLHENEHVFLVLESLECENDKAIGEKVYYHHLRRVELFRDPKNPKHAFISVTEMDFKEAQILESQCIYMVYGITPEKGKNLLENIGLDLGREIGYQAIRFIPQGCKKDNVPHNCLTWSLNQLMKIGVNIPHERGLAIPSSFLRESGDKTLEPTSGGKCLVM